MYDLTFWTYIITNKKNGTLYTGHTDDIDIRMDQHLTGHFGGFSAKYDLKHLVWFEEFESRDDAFTKERQIKEWKRAWKIVLIETLNPHWLDLHTVPMWPLPDKHQFSERYNACMKHSLDPDFRRDER